jgi:rubrerythrin
MHSPADQVEIIGLMAAHESAVAELYRAYGSRLPEHKELFEGLAAEEVGHARQIARFADKVRAGSVHVDAGRFSSESILASLDHIRGRMEEAEETELSFAGALSVAIDLEDALIERRYFEIFEDDTPELKELLRSLEAETEEHRQRLGKARERERGATR